MDTGKKIADALDDLDLTLINTQYAYGSPTFRDISVLDVAMTNDLSLVTVLYRIRNKIDFHHRFTLSF